MDPREALIRHANDTKKDRQAEYFTKVFQKNQPKPIFAKRTLERDLDEEEEKKQHQEKTEKLLQNGLGYTEMVWMLGEFEA